MGFWRTWLNYRPKHNFEPPNSPGLKTLEKTDANASVKSEESLASLASQTSPGHDTRGVTTRSETSSDSLPPSNRPLSALNRVLRADFYKRRFGPYESTYISRFEKCDLGRLRGILKKNRLKQFQIENDSQKGGTIPGKSRHKVPISPKVWTSRLLLS